MVKPEIKIDNAISLGVFWRLAPSTRDIILSINVLPGSEVMRIKIWSLITFVPPVTADRSPPLSRITGADSPVIADSSTLAIPSITSPSEGITSPASQTTTSPFLSSVALINTSCLPAIFRAIVCVRFLRRLSAWAFPLPSAMASEKLANNTVNQSQIAIFKLKDEKLPWKIPIITTRVVRKDPMATIKMTGFFIIKAGFSLMKLSFTACAASLRLNKLIFCFVLIFSRC